MRVLVAALLCVVFAVPAAAQQHAWVAVESVSQALGTLPADPYFAVAPLSDGRALASGGEDEFGNIVANAALFDGISGWTATGAMTTPRWSHAMTRLQNGNVMAISGVAAFNDLSNNSLWACSGGPLTSFELYSPASGMWTAGTSSMRAGRWNAPAATLNDGRVIVVGGHGLVPSGDRFGYNPPCAYGNLATAELYDPTSNSWTSMPMNGVHTIFDTQLFVLSDGRVVALDSDLSEIFDPRTATWTNFAVPHHESMGTALADGRLFVLGGFLETPSVTSGYYPTTAAVFDPHTNTWSDTAAIPRLFSFGGAVVQPDGTVLVGGGAFFDWVYHTNCSCYYDDNYSYGTGLTYVYDPVADTWSDGPPSQLLNMNGSVFNWTTSAMVPTGPGRLLFIDRSGFRPLAAIFRVVTPPVAVANNQAFAGLNGLTAQYTLDASGSSDADGDALVQYTWSENGTVLATSTTPTAAVLLSGGQTHNLTLTVTDATTQTGSTQVTITIYDPTQQLQTALAAANANIKSLQSQLAAANASLTAANNVSAGLTTQIAAMTAQLKSLQTFFASTFSHPSFTLPGATVQAQLQNLVTAIQQLNHAQQQALYKNLGGKKKK